MELLTLEDLELLTLEAIEQKCSLGLFILNPELIYPELIVNPYENLEAKLKYWKTAYTNDLEHKHNKEIKIVGYNIQ